MKSGGSMLRPIDREPAIGLPCHSGGLSPHAKAGMVAPAVCTIFQPGRLAFLEAPVRGLFSTPLSRSALQGRPDRTPYYETPEGTQGYAPVFAPSRQRSVGLAVILRIPRRIKVEAAFSLKFLF